MLPRDASVTWLYTHKGRVTSNWKVTEKSRVAGKPDHRNPLSDIGKNRKRFDRRVLMYVPSKIVSRRLKETRVYRRTVVGPK